MERREREERRRGEEERRERGEERRRGGKERRGEKRASALRRSCDEVMRVRAAEDQAAGDAVCCLGDGTKSK